MTWNHRLVRENDSIRVREVYYDDDGKPNGWCEGEAIWFPEEDDDEPVESISKQLEWMLAACDKPILDAATDFGSAVSETVV